MPTHIVMGIITIRKQKNPVLGKTRFLTSVFLPIFMSLGNVFTRQFLLTVIKLRLDSVKMIPNPHIIGTH